MEYSRQQANHPVQAYPQEHVAFVPAQTQQYPVQPGAPPSYQDLPYPTNPVYTNQTPGYPVNQAPGFNSQVHGYPSQQTEMGYAGQGHMAEPKDEPPAYLSPSDSSQNIMAEFSGFSEKAIRNAFIRKVYAILMLQLGFTVGIIALFVFEKRVKYFVQTNPGVYIAAYVVFLGVYIALVCCSSLRRKYPHNIIMLAVFTVALTYLVAAISSTYDTYIVIMAMGICTAVCLAISVFSCFTKFDFTSCGGVLFVLSWVLLLFGIIAICTYRYYPILNTVYAGLGALLFMMFLAFDTQMVMGGKKYQLSPEEYIFASLQLYLDIVYIFLFLLTILGGGKK